MVTNREANSEYYDQVSQVYDKKHTISTKDFDQFKKDLSMITTDEITGKKVLDCGCGTGRGAIKFGLLGNEVTALDISSEIVKICGRNAEKMGLDIETIAGDCTNMPFEDGTFDIVSTSAALHHLEDLDQALSELRRVLKPNGKLILIAEPKRAVIRPKWIRDIKERLSAEYDRKTTGYTGPKINPDVHIFKTKELAKKLEVMGFGKIKFHYFYTATSLYRDLLFYRIYDQKKRERLLNFFISIDNTLFSILPASFKSLFHLSAEKLKDC